QRWQGMDELARQPSCRACGNYAPRLLSRTALLIATLFTTMTLTLFIYLLSIVCWLGGMVFFSLFTAPVIFSVLAQADAGKVVEGIFHRYYLLGYVAGAIGLVL